MLKQFTTIEGLKLLAMENVGPNFGMNFVVITPTLAVDYHWEQNLRSQAKDGIFWATLAVIR